MLILFIRKLTRLGKNKLGKCLAPFAAQKSSKKFRLKFTKIQRDFRIADLVEVLQAKYRCRILNKCILQRQGFCFLHSASLKSNIHELLP